MRDKHSNFIFKSQECWKYIYKDERQLNVPAQPEICITGQFFGLLRITSLWETDETDNMH